MAETLLDIKSFSGLNFSPHLQTGECQDCYNLDDANAPALRTARGFDIQPVTGSGTFQGAWVEDGEVRATVWDDTLHFGEQTFALKPLGVARRFMRISYMQVLIQPDMYVFYPAYYQCYPYDNRFTTSGIVSTAENVLTVTLHTKPQEGFSGKVYVDGIGLTYYDEETAPNVYLLYFNVVSTELMGNGWYRLVLTPVYRDGIETYFNINTTTDLTVRQVMPQITHAALCRNRLWGAAGKKLVASKLGNPLVFDDFSGLSTDSFELPLEEPLTAVTHFGERVVALSKTTLYELYGDRPSNYQISAPKVGGCVCPMSVCNAGGYLIYADDKHVYRYGGGDPQPVTDRLEFPAWTSMFGVSDGETCLLGMDIGRWRLFRYRPSKNTFCEIAFAASGGFIADGKRYFHDTLNLYCATHSRPADSSYRYRSGWLNLDRLGSRAPRELCIHLDGAFEQIALVTRDGELRPLTAVDDRGDGLLRLPFPADLMNRVFAVDIRGKGDVCLHRITVRG